MQPRVQVAYAMHANVNNISVDNQPKYIAINGAIWETDKILQKNLNWIPLTKAINKTFLPDRQATHLTLYPCTDGLNINKCQVYGKAKRNMKNRYC